MITDWAQVVADVLQRAYGDATQVTLDHQAAAAVLNELGRRGWAAPEYVAALVASAGGHIDLQDRHLADPPSTVQIHQHTLDVQRVSVR